MVHQNNKLCRRIACRTGCIYWPEQVKNIQKQWIGKNNGTVITFQLASESSTNIGTLDVFTTRPDTLFGVTSYP